MTNANKISIADRRPPLAGTSRSQSHNFQTVKMRGKTKSKPGVSRRFRELLLCRFRTRIGNELCDGHLRRFRIRAGLTSAQCRFHITKFLQSLCLKKRYFHPKILIFLNLKLNFLLYTRFFDRIVRFYDFTNRCFTQTHEQLSYRQKYESFTQVVIRLVLFSPLQRTSIPRKS